MKTVWMVSNVGPVSAEIDDRAAHRIEKSFTYHAPNTENKEKYESIRDIVRHATLNVERLCPDSREKSLALTKMEEALMWANASIARYGE